MSIPAGSAAEWFAGLATVAAVVVALVVSHRAEKAAETAAQEARQAVARDRTARLLIDLVRAVERDIGMFTAHGNKRVGDLRSAEGSAMCRALWGHRGSFGTVWAVYCEDDQTWTQQLHRNGELFPRMRSELQEAIELLDHQDRSAGRGEERA